MTDKEIIKALECCKKDDCDNCPNDFGNCYANLSGYSLELINRQQEEIDRLRKEVNLVSIQFQDLQERYEEVQTEIEQWKEEANKYQKLWCIAIDERERIYAKATCYPFTMYRRCYITICQQRARTECKDIEKSCYFSWGYG